MLHLNASPPAPPLDGHLAMGEPAGTTDAIHADSRSLLRDDDRWLPVMGEFHFSRHPPAEWREELLKIKAGGITVVATYVLWILHEERRGHWRWDGDRDLRRFVELCAKAGLDVVARIGPWAHGETRNGGFPDWLLAEDCTPRTDDPTYLALVRSFYEQVARQLAGLTHGEGGPIVAVQVENELYDQPEHLDTLRTMAEELGIHVPLWTATAWGGAELPADRVLPLYGGYPEAFWADAGSGWARENRRHYFFTPIRDDHAIGADLRGTARSGAGPDTTRYPFATCELGGGMAIAYHRRPRVPADDVAALALTKLGSGSAWQGYYLYHGCVQVEGELSSTQESHATGYPNDLPRRDYDFQAPIGAYGQVRPSYHALRPQHLMLEHSGSALAGMDLVLPEHQPSGLDDRDTLRWAVRSDGDSGFLFVNNHQPFETLSGHHDVQFSVRLGEQPILLPPEPADIPVGAYFAWPLRRPIGSGIRLVSASAQLVTGLEHDGAPLTVLARTAGITPHLVFDGATVTSVTGPAEVFTDADGHLHAVTARPGTGCILELAGAGGTAKVLVLTEDQALQLWKVDVWGSERLLLCGEPLVADGAQLRFHTAEAEVDLSVLPAPVAVTIGSDEFSGQPDGAFTRFVLSGSAARSETVLVEPVRTSAPAAAAVRLGGPEERASAPTAEDFLGAARYQVHLPASAFEGSGEVLLRIDWTGDAGRLWAAGELLSDTFWFGDPWEVGLRRHAGLLADGGVLELELLPLRKDAPVYVVDDVRPDFSGADEVLELRSVELVRVATVPVQEVARD